MLGDSGGEIVIPEFPCDPAQELESVEVTAHESLETLAVRELHKQFAAMTFDQTEGIELARVTLVEKGTEVTPVDFEALPRSWLHAHIGTLDRGVCSHRVQVIFQDAQTTVEAKWAEPLRDHHGTRLRILLQQFGDGGFERIQFAGALSASCAACRCDQVLGDGSASQVEMTGDLAHRPVLGPVQAMNRVDLFRGQHDSAATV